MLVAAAALAGWVGPAVAEAPVKHGWWNRANDGTLPLEAPAPPDVPEDGLYVAAAGEPLAVSAVSYTVPDGARPTELVLTVTGSPVGEIAVRACPVAVASLDYEPVQNGRWNDAPEPDCERASVEGQPGESGDTVVFDLGELSVDGSLALVLLAGGDGRLAFERPGGDSLSLAVGTSTAGIEPLPSPAPMPGVPPVGSPGSAGELPPPVIAPQPPLQAVTAPAAAPRDEGGAGPAGLVTRVAGAVGDDGLSVAARVGRGVLVAALAALLMYYAQGRGILGARYDR